MPQHVLKGMALLLIIIGIGMLGAHIAKAGNFLVIGLALTVVGLSLGVASNVKKT